MFTSKKVYLFLDHSNDELCGQWPRLCFLLLITMYTFSILYFWYTLLWVLFFFFGLFSFIGVVVSYWWMVIDELGIGRTVLVPYQFLISKSRYRIVTDGIEFNIGPVPVLVCLSVSHKPLLGIMYPYLCMIKTYFLCLL